jgi:regulator of PEP synthase PpsR (kinase-PPPase family)
MLTIFIVSGATGETGDRVARAALAQFENAPASVVRRRYVRSPEQVRAVVQEARDRDSVILHTLVSSDLRRLILTEARLHEVDVMDILGPVMDRLSARMKVTPLGKPGLLAQLAEARSREIDAVDFAFRHDDGQRADQLDRAEIVLVGVSRSMKTPTTLYLAYRGWFAANVPIIPDVPLPAPLIRLPSERVFCLTMAPDRLQELRRARAQDGVIPLHPYGSPRHIREELQCAKKVSLAHGWRMIDVTGKSVEEVAREIIALVSPPDPALADRGCDRDGRQHALPQPSFIPIDRLDHAQEADPDQDRCSHG